MPKTVVELTDAELEALVIALTSSLRGATPGTGYFANVQQLIERFSLLLKQRRPF